MWLSAREVRVKASLSDLPYPSTRASSRLPCPPGWSLHEALGSIPSNGEASHEPEGFPVKPPTRLRFTNSGDWLGMRMACRAQGKGTWFHGRMTGKV